MECKERRKCSVRRQQHVGKVGKKGEARKHEENNNTTIFPSGCEGYEAGPGWGIGFILPSWSVFLAIFTRKGTNASPRATSCVRP